MQRLRLQGHEFIPITARADKALVLRPLRPEDARHVHRLYADRCVAEPCRIAAPTSSRTATELLRRWEERQRAMAIRRWAVALRQGPLVGTCGLLNIARDGDRSAYLTYALSPPYWGQGVMRGALERVLDIAFNTMRLDRLYAEVEPTNDRSSGLLRRLGFVLVRECAEDRKLVYELALR